jgi:hypothetical protein
LVVAKVQAQARNISPDLPAHRKLLALAREVRSGDPANVEAQAARVYWQNWLSGSVPYSCSEESGTDPLAPDAGPVEESGTDPLPPCSTGSNADPLAPPQETVPHFGSAKSGTDPLPSTDPLDFIFRRDPDLPGLNSFLNYGYAVVRAAIARSIVAAGLLPSVGLHHRNRSNAFCLADDLIEPLRPLVDDRVRELHKQGYEELNQPAKAAILEILADRVQFGNEVGPLMVEIHRYVASLVRCFTGDAKELVIPVAMQSEPEETNDGIVLLPCDGERDQMSTGDPKSPERSAVVIREATEEG